MFVNGASIIKKYYKSLLGNVFDALLVTFYLITFVNFLVYYRAESKFTLLEYLLIGLEGSTFVFLYNFRNRLKSSPSILNFLLWLFFFIISDSFKQVFSNEYHLLRGILDSFLFAIVATYLVPKLSNKCKKHE